jgi:hypothetical protein
MDPKNACEASGNGERTAITNPIASMIANPAGMWTRDTFDIQPPEEITASRSTATQRRGNMDFGSADI